MISRWMGWTLIVLTAFVMAALTACGEKSNTGSTTAQNGPGDPERGRRIYMTVCITCHNPDPSKDGPIGPAIKGSSPELIEARVLYQSYPPGYTPKRTTHLMPKQPQLAKNIPDLAAYLNP
jgi:mono/diheme cytochrome c family protein